MTDLVTLRAQRQKLVEAIANPNSRVAADGKSVDKRSVSELRDALSIIDAQISVLAPSAGSARIIRTMTSKGC